MHSVWGAPLSGFNLVLFQFFHILANSLMPHLDTTITFAVPQELSDLHMTFGV